MSAAKDLWNGARFVPANGAGHYESWFQRANHPTRPLAFWIRYTVFAPRDRPGAAIGELWAVWFDGEKKRIVATKEEHPIGACDFSKSGLEVRIDSAKLDRAGLAGACRRGDHAIRWSLRYASNGAPLLLLPEAMYARGLPKAKALVGSPFARFDGSLEIDGETIAIERWIGSQNHNWGSKHTDRYAWGQVAGFDDAPDVFLEASTAQIALGPVMSPKMTVLVVRDGDEELRLNAVVRALRARAHFEPFYWELSTKERGVHVHASFSAPAWSFVALPYMNPPGGTKTCLNSKLAACTLSIERNGKTRVLQTKHRAAFELLSDDPAPRGVQRLEE